MRETYGSRPVPNLAECVEMPLDLAWRMASGYWAPIEQWADMALVIHDVAQKTHSTQEHHGPACVGCAWQIAGQRVAGPAALLQHCDACQPCMLLLSKQDDCPSSPWHPENLE